MALKAVALYTWRRGIWEACLRRLSVGWGMTPRVLTQMVTILWTLRTFLEYTVYAAVYAAYAVDVGYAAYDVYDIYGVYAVYAS